MKIPKHKIHLKDDIYISYNSGFIVTQHLQTAEKTGKQYLTSGLTFNSCEGAVRGCNKHYGVDVTSEEVNIVYEKAKVESLIEVAKKSAEKVKLGSGGFVKKEGGDD